MLYDIYFSLSDLASPCMTVFRSIHVSENGKISFLFLKSLSNIPLYICIVCVRAQLCSILCDPMDCSWPGSSAHGFSRQEYCLRLPFPSPGHLPDPGIEAGSLVSLALAGRCFSTVPPGKAVCMYYIFFIHSSVYGHPGCFRVLAVVYSAAVNTGVHVAF